MKSLLPVPAGPARVSDVRAAFAAGNEAIGRAPERSVAGAASAPPVGSVEDLNARRAAMLEAAPDFRGLVRRRVDETWRAMLSDVERRYGKAITLDPWNQRDAGGTIALKRCRALEAQVIALASTGASKAAIDEAWDHFAAGVAAFLNEATAGWKRVDAGGRK